MSHFVEEVAARGRWSIVDAARCNLTLLHWIARPAASFRPDARIAMI
jgi:hypothetical protein